MQKKIVDFIKGMPIPSPMKTQKIDMSKASASTPAEHIDGKGVDLRGEQPPLQPSALVPSHLNSDGYFPDDAAYADMQNTPTKTLRLSTLTFTFNNQVRTQSSRTQSFLSGTSPLRKQDAASSPTTPTKSASSIWDPDDTEFDENVYSDLKNPAKTYQVSCGSFRHFSANKRLPVSFPSLGSIRSISTCNTIIHKPMPAIRRSMLVCNDSSDNDDSDTLLSEQEHKEPLLPDEEGYHDLVQELTDADYMEPTGYDLHDDIIAKLFIDAYPGLPVYEPARRMHIINHEQLSDMEDIPLLEYANPRLCDAIATILFESNPKILGAFLDPKKGKFEWWCHTPAASKKPSVVIRRAHSEVTVGTFRSQGFQYIWGYYVKTINDFGGFWMETFASSSLASTKLTKEGPDWESFEYLEAPPNHPDPEDPKYALCAGRWLARSLLDMKVWKYNRLAGEICEWAVDGGSMEVTGS